jgi:hypothetical protein
VGTPRKKIAIIAVLGLAALVAVALFVRGRARPLAEVAGEVRDLTVTPQGCFWIDAPAQAGKGPARIYFIAHGSRGGAAKLLEFYDIRSLAVHGQTAYALVETGPEDGAGQLVAQTGAGPAQTLLGGLHSPQGLIVTDSLICWTESRAAPVEGIAHVPILGALSAIRTVPASGGKPGPDSQPRLLAMAESATPHYEGQVLGARDGNLYWTERLASRLPGAVTIFRRAPETGGEPQTLGQSRGAQIAALGEEHIYWTDASEELAVPSSGRVVRRLPLQGGEQEAITDWLPSAGALCTDADRPYYAGGGWLWAIPRTLDKPMPVLRCNASSPGSLSVYRDNVIDLGVKPGAKQLFRQPLSWRGYIGGALAGVTPFAAARGAEAP